MNTFKTSLIFLFTCLLYCGVSVFTPGGLSAQTGLVKIIGSANDDAVTEMRIVNDEVYVCGRTTDPSNVEFATMAKYDLSGNRLWETALPTPRTALADFTVLPNGDIYAVGLTLPWNSGADNQTLLARFDAAGNLVVSTLLYQTGRERAYRILPKPDGSGLIVLAESNITSTNTIDQGLILEVDFGLNVTSRKRHAIGGSDTQWARDFFYNSPTELLVTGISPALSGDMGLAIADADGNFTGENYRLSSPGTNRVTPYSLNKGVNGELYVAGSVNLPERGMLMSLHADDFSVRWAYDFPGLDRISEITAPDINGFFHAVGFVNTGGVNRSILMRFQETATGLNLLYAKYLDDGETFFGQGQIALRNQDVVYVDNRDDNPAGFGQSDYLFAYLNAEYESCITFETELEFNPLEVDIAGAEVAQTELDPVEQEFFEEGNEIFLEQADVCGGCGELVITDKAYDCAPQPTYTVTFDVVNNSAYPVTSMVVRNDYDPTQDAYFNLFSSPIPANGGIATGLTLTLTFPVDLTVPLDICFDVIFFSDEAVCCHFETCFELLPPDPCSNVSAEYEELEDPEIEGEGECCYALYLNNDFCSEYFTNVTTEIVTPDVVFTQFTSTLLNATISSDSTSIVWDNPGGFLPLGPLDDMTICLGGILSATQIPQQVAVNWYTIDPATGEEVIACTDTLEFFCQPCLILEEEAVICDPASNGYLYNFTVTNNSDHVVTSIVLENHTPGVTFDPPLIDVVLNPGDTYSGTISIDDGGTLNPGDPIVYKLILFDEEGWCCHLDDVTLTVPDCEEGPLTDPDEEFDPPVHEQVNQWLPLDYPLDQDTEGMELNLYPSPTSDFLQVEVSIAGDYIVEIFSSDQRRLLQRRVTMNAGQAQRLDVNAWPAGIYVLRITQVDGSVRQKRFVKM